MCHNKHNISFYGWLLIIFYGKFDNVCLHSYGFTDRLKILDWGGVLLQYLIILVTIETDQGMLF